jgi:hypothetical protein
LELIATTIQSVERERAEELEKSKNWKEELLRAGEKQSLIGTSANAVFISPTKREK